MAPSRALIFLPNLLILLSFGAQPLPAAAPSADQTQAQLKALKERIERVSRDVGRDAVERDRLSKNLRSAELAVSAAQSDLDDLRTQETAHSKQRSDLADERARVSASLDHERATLAIQLQVAYQIGRHRYAIAWGGVFDLAHVVGSSVQNVVTFWTTQSAGSVS